MNGSRVAKPMSGPVRPVVPKMDPMNGTDTMHYEWIVRESVRTTEILTADNYLEVPVLKLPRRFLHLAAEARTVEITNDKLCCLSDVQPQGIELPKPVLVTVMMDSPVRQCKLMDRVDRGVSPDTTEQPLLLGLDTDERETAPTDMGDSDANSAKHSEPVDRLGPVDPLNMTEQPASLGLRMDGTENIPVYQEGSVTFLAGQDEPVNRLRPVGSQNISDQPVVLGLVPYDKGKISTGPLDHDLVVADQMERADRPILVMPHNETEQLVFLGVEVERVTYAPVHTMVPDVVMFRDQSSSDRPAEQDETHRPVGTERKHAENNVNGSMAGGPVGQLYNSDPLCPGGVPSMDDPLHPLTLDPVGQPPITGPPDKHVSEPGCGRINRIQYDPGGSTGILDTASQTSSNVSADRLNIGTFGRLANSVDATPSSDSGIHSWKEQWENMSELSSDDASGQPVRSDWSSSGQVHTSDIRTPPNTEEEGDSDYPWRDRMVSRKLCGSSSDALYDENDGCTYSTVSGVASARYADIAVLSDFSDESEEAERTRLADGRGPGTGQPILVPDDVAPLPVKGGYGRYFAREIKALAMTEGYRPESPRVWGDREVLSETFVNGTTHLLQEALAKGEDAFEDDECPVPVRRFLRNMRVSMKVWGEHGCTVTGCSCSTSRNRLLGNFLEDIIMDNWE